MLREMKITEFIDELASDSPAPGGGSVAALCGALSCGLSSMVCRLTLGKKGYENVQDDIDGLLVKLEQKRVTLTKLIDVDTEAFNRVMASYKLPKETDEEKAARSKEIQDSMKGAADVPFQVMCAVDSIMGTILQVAEKGNKNSITDAGVSALLAGAAIRGAAYNVQINLPYIKDQEFIIAYSEKTGEILQRTEENEKKILEIVQKEMSN